MDNLNCVEKVFEEFIKTDEEILELKGKIKQMEKIQTTRKRKLMDHLSGQDEKNQFMDAKFGRVEFEEKMVKRSSVSATYLTDSLKSCPFIDEDDVEEIHKFIWRNRPEEKKQRLVRKR